MSGPCQCSSLVYTQPVWFSLDIYSPWIMQALGTNYAVVTIESLILIKQKSRPLSWSAIILHPNINPCCPPSAGVSIWVKSKRKVINSCLHMLHDPCTDIARVRSHGISHFEGWLYKLNCFYHFIYIISCVDVNTLFVRIRKMKRSLLLNRVSISIDNEVTEILYVLSICLTN